jgi:hypothetical protein
MLSTQNNLCFIVIGFVLRSVAVHQSICSKLVTNTTLFRILQWFFLISNLSQTHLDGQRQCKDLVWNTQIFVLVLIISKSFGTEFFHTLKTIQFLRALWCMSMVQLAMRHIFKILILSPPN